MRLYFFAAIALISMPAAAQSGITGNWSGTYSYSVQVAACSNKTFSTSGNATVTFFQIGSLLSGRMDQADMLDFSNGCNPAKAEFTSVLLGSISGSAVTWRFPNDSTATQFSGTLAGDTITATLEDANGGSGTITLTRTAGDLPTVDFTGTWSGNYNFTDVCPNGANKSYSGAMIFALTQANGAVTGLASMQNVPLYDQSCKTVATFTMVMEVAGNVSGSTFTGAVYEPSGSFDFPITATVSGTSLTGSASGASLTSTAGAFNLTQSSAQPGASDFAGQYDLSYDEVDNETLTCANIGSLAFSGSGSIALVQAGDLVTGSIALEDTQTVVSDIFGDCVPVNAGEQVLPLFGTLSNNQLSATLAVGSTPVNYAVAFSGDTMTATLTDSFGDLLTIDGTRQAVPPPSARRRAVVP